MIGYIYKTTNLINGKIYIGQHVSSKFDRDYKGSGILIQKAFKKYGWDNFLCEIIQVCDSRDDLDASEIYWIDFYTSQNLSIGYNISDGGRSPRFHGENHPMWGKHHTNMSKNKISAAQKKRYEENPNLKLDISTCKINYYKSEEGIKTKKNMSEKFKLIYKSPSKNKKVINNGEKMIYVYPEEIPEYINKGWNLGRLPFSEEHKKKISQNLVGRKQSDEAKKKMSESHLGKPHPYKREYTEELRIKMSNSHKGKKQNPDAIKKRTLKIKQLRWINNGEINKRVLESVVDDYISVGWFKGRIK